jgi:hypothetical protein
MNIYVHYDAQESKKQVVHNVVYHRQDLLESFFFMLSLLCVIWVVQIQAHIWVVQIQAHIWVVPNTSTYLSSTKYKHISE